MPVGIHAGEIGQDPVPRVRDENGMVICEKCPVLADEVEQVGHLLKIRRDIGIVPQKMDVIEDEINYMLDIAVGGVKLATAGCCGRSRERSGRDQ